MEHEIPWDRAAVDVGASMAKRDAAEPGPVALAVPVLHPADHQVAGHRFDEGRLGSSVDESGRFYKPLQGDERGNREIEFYSQFAEDTSVPPHIRSFFPKYFGTVSIEALNGGGAVRHGVMEDLAHGFHHASIIDLKVGFRTWYPEATEHNITKNKLKDKKTTSGALGFRVSGMQVYEASTGTTFRADRDWARNLTVDGVTLALKRYVSSNPRDEANPDAAFASSVYGGKDGVIAQLEILKDWFTTQTNYHFASSSVLFIYEADAQHSASTTTSATHATATPTDDSSGPQQASKTLAVKMVDFAHTISGKSTVDDNFLEGLKSVIALLSSIVKSSSTSSTSTS